MTALGWQLFDGTHLEDGHAKYALSLLKGNNKLEKNIEDALDTEAYLLNIFSSLCSGRQ